MGNALPYPMIFDRLLLDACQVTNPSIDPLREPMELRTYLGKKPAALSVREYPDGDIELLTKLTPNLQIETPIMIGHMSYGGNELKRPDGTCKSGEQSRYVSWEPEKVDFMNRSILTRNTSLFRWPPADLVSTSIISNAEPPLRSKSGRAQSQVSAGTFPVEKVCADVSCTRMIPEGSDAISPAPHHDIYSIEDLEQTCPEPERSDRMEKAGLRQDRGSP